MHEIRVKQRAKGASPLKANKQRRALVPAPPQTQTPSLPQDLAAVCDVRMSRSLTGSLR